MTLASTNRTTTVTIIDDDPEVTVGIDLREDSVAEGDSLEVAMTLSEDPMRPVEIAFEWESKGDTDAADSDYDLPDSITFNSGETTKSFTFTSTENNEADSGKAVSIGPVTNESLPPGVTTDDFKDEITITIIDDDPAVTVTFGAATYSADEGDSVDVTVTLSADPQRSVTIPIAGTGESGGTSADFDVPDSVTFASGDTSKTISFTATEDTIDDDDEKIKLAFGTLPPGVSAGSTSSTKVSIVDDDDPQVKVEFGSATYSVNEGSSVTVTVKLDADPERTVAIPLSATYEGGTSSADFMGIPVSVSFDTGDRSKTFSVTTRDDFIDNDAKKAEISFGASLPDRVAEDTVNETVISVTDNETRGVTVFPTTLTIEEDETGTYTLHLDSEPTGDVTLTINAPTDSDEASSDPTSLTFTPGDWYTDQTVTITALDDELDESSETATFTHSLSGADYGSTTAVDVVVTITDNDETPVITGSATPNFAEFEYDADAAAFDKTVATYTATDGDMDDVTWSLSGADSGLLSITENSDGKGVLSFNDPPDYENPTDSGSGNNYEFTVEASDGTNTGTRDVTVTVTPVNERPTLTDTYNAVLSYETRYYEVASGNDLIQAIVVGTDPESDDITWSLGGADKDDFIAIVSSNGTGIVFSNQPDYEQPTDADEDNTYNVILKASDGEKTRERAYIFHVDDLNERPDIDEDTVADHKEIEFDSTATPGSVHTFSATDYDEGDTFTWSLEGDDADAFDIDSDTGVLTFVQDTNSGPLPDFENPTDDDDDNIYEITVKATDDDSRPLFSSYDVTVEVTAVNETPELTGTPSTAISQDENEAFTETLADYNARDEEGTTIAWSLTGTDRGDFAISTDGIVTFAATPNFEDAKDSNKDNVYSFNVNASDSVNTRTLAVTVTVADLEEDGTISVSNLNPGVGGDEIRFTLSDPDGAIEVGAAPGGFEWTIQTRTSETAPWRQFTRANNGELFATYTAPEEHIGRQVRAIVESYRDRRGTGKSADSEPTAAVTADPIANAPPRFLDGGTITVTEGTTNLNVGSPLKATDRDGDTVTFGLGTGDDSDLFEFNASTRQLRSKEALDFETTTLGFLFVNVNLSDGKGVDTNNMEIADTTIDIETTVTISVVDVEEPGVVTLSAEEPEAGTELEATLADGDGSVIGESWQWARSENGRISISGAESSFYTPTEDDEDFYLRARVEYTDNRGSGKSAEGITTGPVPSENRRPNFPDTETGDRTVSENTRSGVNVGAPVAAVDPENNRLTYTLTGTDADAFTIVASSGQIRVKDSLDYETKDSYSVTVNVQDGRDGAGATSTDIDNMQDVTITVEDVEEHGTVTLTTDTEHISARVEVTAELSDPDESVTGLTWQWSHSPNGRTDWANILDATDNAYTPQDGHEGRYIRATASYTDGQGPNKTAHGVSPRRVAEPPPVNSPPAFPSTENGRREVPENSAAGTTIGDPVVATDLNADDAAVNDPLVYSLTGTDAASFTIDSGTGQLQVGQNVELDFEGKRSYRVTVQVTDGRDQNGDEDNDVIDVSIDVSINVMNVNEEPTVSGEATASFTENGSGAIATYPGKDPERDDLTWSVSGADGDNFAMTAQGRLHFASPPSFEGGKTEYAVTVVATDEGDPGLTGTFDVTVTVTDVEEEGAVTITPPRGWTGTQFSAALADGDGDGSVSDQTWQWARSTNRSSWTDISGQTSSAYTATADDVGNYLRVSTEYTDGRGSGKTAEAVLTVRIADVADKPAMNETPAFADATTTRSIAEGTAPGRSIGSAVRARDADRDDVLIYSLSGTDASSFDIDPRTGQLRTKSVLFHDPDPQAPNTYTVTVEVHDGFDQQYAPLTTADDSIDVTITVTAVTPPPPPVVKRPTPPVAVVVDDEDEDGGGGGGTAPANRSPEFREGSTTGRWIAENTPANVAIGAPVTATDPEGNTLTYALSGPDAALFTIDERRGRIRVGVGTMLDYEADQNVYAVTVTAVDASGARAAVTVNIRVTNVELPGKGNDYDADHNEKIDRDEAIAAVADYFRGVITKDETLAIINLYFTG